MANTSKVVARNGEQTPISSIVTLARWRWRQNWFLLLMTGVGIVAAIVIITIVPLLAQVTNTAGLRTALTATPESSQLFLNTSTQGLSTQVVHGIQQQIDPFFQQHLKSYLGGNPQVSGEVQDFTILSPKTGKSGDQMILYSYPMTQATSHINIITGRTPASTIAAHNELEVLLTQMTAQQLHVGVGSLIKLQFSLYSSADAVNNGQSVAQSLNLRVVGLFNTASDDPFWHGDTFQPTALGQWTTYNVLLSYDALLAMMDSIAQHYKAKAVFTAQSYALRWNYRLNPAHIDATQLDDLVSQLSGLQLAIANKYGNLQAGSQTVAPFPYLQQVNLSGPLFTSADTTSTLEQYRNRIAVAQIPITILSLQVAALILFFISMMAELLIDRQADAIAVLRSRGASGRQIFGSLVTQSILVSVLALLIGLPLAVVAVYFIGMKSLAPAEQGALTVLSNNPAQVLSTSGTYALGAALVAILAMVFSLNRATRMDVLSIRHEAARSTRKALWQRLNLDIVAAIIALTGYAVSLYVTNIGGLLDARTRSLVSAPLTLIAPIFLLIALILLFLRLFPLLLSLGAAFAGRSRGAASLLALAQMARAPRQVIRMTLLLALATAFAIFTLVFTASQTQRTLDVATYRSGADFSGDMSLASLAPSDIAMAYAHIPGVRSATAGYIVKGVATGPSPAFFIQVNAVDTNTFAQTALWSTQDSAQPLSSLMAQLRAASQDGLQRSALPVIIDTSTATTLQVGGGSTFSMTVNNADFNRLTCIVVGEVQHIPTVQDTSSNNGSSDGVQRGGIIADYQTYATLFAQGLQQNHISGKVLPINHVWLSTRGDASSLASVRSTLQTAPLRLDHLFDRRALLESMQNDPLYLNLIGVLTIGAATALLLALMGSLLASWLSARTRLTNFAVLRALGTTPRQVASVLTWEQVLIYLTALFLGAAFGALLAVTIVPTLVFTSVPIQATANSNGNTDFYTLQRLLPPQILVPTSLVVALMALVLICVVALGMMVRVVSRPSMSQALRLNED